MNEYVGPLLIALNAAFFYVSPLLSGSNTHKGMLVNHRKARMLYALVSMPALLVTLLVLGLLMKAGIHPAILMMLSFVISVFGSIGIITWTKTRYNADNCKRYGVTYWG